MRLFRQLRYVNLTRWYFPICGKRLCCFARLMSSHPDCRLSQSSDLLEALRLLELAESSELSEVENSLGRELSRANHELPKKA